jgi:hypothetical protein
LRGDRIAKLDHLEILQQAMTTGPATLPRPLPGLVTPIVEINYGNVRGVSVNGLLQEAEVDELGQRTKAQRRARVKHVWNGLLQLQEDGQALLPIYPGEQGEVDPITDLENPEYDTSGTPRYFVTDWEGFDEQMLFAINSYNDRGHDLTELRNRPGGYQMESKEQVYTNIDLQPGFEGKRAFALEGQDEPDERTWAWGWSGETLNNYRGRAVALDEFLSPLCDAEDRTALVQVLATNTELDWHFIVDVPLSGYKGKITRRRAMLRVVKPEES